MRLRLPALRFPVIGLPLLSKELVEQAARRRTYFVRVGYACLLFVAAYLIFYNTLRATRTNVAAVLGHGREIFETVVKLQFAGIYLFMPAMTCGVLSLEKERNSLGLLFLTRLGPWTILFEKLFSRLVPMFSFLLLSLPLLAFAYSLGGVSVEFLRSAVVILALTAFQVGALALMCSAWFRTTAEALIGTYVIGFALFGVYPLGDELGLIDSAWEEPWFAILKLLKLLCGPFALSESAQLLGVATRGVPEWLVVAFYCFPMSVSSIVCLLLARVFIVRRAFVQPRNFVLNLFKWLDGLLLHLNQNRVTWGIVFHNKSTSLPENEPVAWRETTKKSLGTTRYLVRVLVAIEFPVALFCILVAIYGVSGSLAGVGSPGTELEFAL